jgi:hypothetical protein
MFKETFEAYCIMALASVAIVIIFLVLIIKNCTEENNEKFGYSDNPVDLYRDINDNRKM